jgi:hypothetical protein
LAHIDELLLLLCHGGLGLILMLLLELGVISQCLLELSL